MGLSKKPSDKPTETVRPQLDVVEYRPGDRVEVRVQGQYWTWKPATVVRKHLRGLFKNMFEVRYDPYLPSERLAKQERLKMAASKWRHFTIQKRGNTWKLDTGLHKLGDSPPHDFRYRGHETTTILKRGLSACALAELKLK